MTKTKKTPRSPELVKQLDNRLNRVIGQLQGVKKMVDNNAYCGDIIVQVGAALKAVQKIGYLLLDDHLKTCVTDSIEHGDLTLVNDAINLIKKVI